MNKNDVLMSVSPVMNPSNTSPETVYLECKLYPDGSIRYGLKLIGFINRLASRLIKIESIK